MTREIRATEIALMVTSEDARAAVQNAGEAVYQASVLLSSAGSMLADAGLETTAVTLNGAHQEFLKGLGALGEIMRALNG